MVGRVRPLTGQSASQRHGFGPRGWWRALGLACPDTFLQVRQRRRHARLQEHFGIALATPDHQRRTMIRTLKTGAFIAGGFRDPLAVGLLVVQSAGRKQFSSFKRNFAKIDGLILQVAPLIYKLSAVAHVNDVEVIAAGFWANLVLVVVAVPARTPPIAVTTAVIHFRRSVFLDVNDPKVRSAVSVAGCLDEHLYPCRVSVLQAGKRQAIRAVLMLQQPDELRRRV